jgi:hypothetical protein
MIRKKIVVGNHINFARNGAARYAALAGTVSVTNGDATVTCTSSAGLSVGDTLVIAGVTVTIDTITDGTHIELDAVWAGDTAAGLSAGHSIAGAASSTVKPARAVEANWTRIGSCLDLEPKNEREEDKVYDPSPGAYEISDIITKSKSMMFDGTIQEGSAALFEMLFMADGAIEDDFTPMLGDGQLYAWWQIKQYDKDNTLLNIVEFWGIGTVSGHKFDNNLVRYKLSIRLLANALNAGTLSFA